MTNLSAATRAAILLAMAFTACDGPRGLPVVERPDTDSAGGHDAPDAAAARPETAEATRALPPPPMDPCAPLHLQYTGAGGEGSYDCPTIDCHCDGYAYVGPVSSALHGCVQSVDCAVACGGELWLTCAAYACASDADCDRLDAGHCVVVPGATEGLCQIDVDAFSPCVDVGDCSAGQRCVVVKPDGTRNCIDPTANARGPCNEDADCPAGRCVLQGAGFLGVCPADGVVDAACGQDADCASGHCARNAAISACTTGGPSSKCVDDGNCVTGTCQHPAGYDASYNFGACD